LERRGQGCGHTAHSGQDSHGTAADRERSPNVQLHGAGPAAHGHAAGSGHAEAPSGRAVWSKFGLNGAIN